MKSLLNRVKTHFSDTQAAEEERLRVRDVIRANGYPRHLLKERRVSRQTGTSVRPRATAVLPYVRNVSEKIARLLQGYNVKVFFRPGRRLSDILRLPKDRSSPQETKGVVYRLHCSDCDSCYVGQTGNALATRVKQHEAACRLLYPEKSVAAAHSIEEDHRMAWEKAEVLTRETNYRKRLFLESWFIQASSNCINRTDPLPPCYDDVIRRWSADCGYF